MKVNQTELLNQYNVMRTNTEGNKIKGSTTGTDKVSQLKELLDSYNQDNSNNDITASYGYSNMTMDSVAVQKLMKETEAIGGTVQQMVRELLDRQGVTEQQLQTGAVGEVKVDDIAQKKAQEMIGPGGELSPEKVSDRIVDFAIGVFGGDKSKIDIIRGAIDRGFKEAEHILGGLSDISNKTYTLIQDKLDKWINSDQNGTDTSDTAQPATE